MESTDQKLSKWKLEESEWERIKEIQEILKVGIISIILVIFKLRLLTTNSKRFFLRYTASVIGSFSYTRRVNPYLQLVNEQTWETAFRKQKKSSKLTI